MQSSLLLLISNGPCFAVACVWLVPALVIAVRRRGTPSLDDVSDVAPEDAPLVSVILPARNERAHIVACVEAMRRTTWPRVEIVVVDDHSTDGTGQLARATANGDARVRVIDAPDLPHGWFGKQWACEVGAAAASGSLLLFTDADTRHSPDLLTRLVSVRAERKAELMSIAGRQDMITVWEQAVQPLVFTMILLRYGSTYHIEHAVRASDVIANGQCFMLSRTAYDAVGRHAAVREYVAEDMMMAQAVWTNGGRISLVVGIEQLRTRMYTGLGSLMRGWGKNMYAGGRYAVRGGAVGRVYLNMSSNHTGEVVKLLTMITLITTPMTLVGTWYGMNFSEQMPEYHWRHGYAVAIAVTVVSTAATYWYFKTKKWF